MRNIFRQFVDLLPKESVEIGDVMASDASSSVVQLPSGDLVNARGSASVGTRVFIRVSERAGISIDGPAPSLPFFTIDA